MRDDECLDTAFLLGVRSHHPPRDCRADSTSQTISGQLDEDLHQRTNAGGKLSLLQDLADLHRTPNKVLIPEK